MFSLISTLFILTFQLTLVLLFNPAGFVVDCDLRCLFRSGTLFNNLLPQEQVTHLSCLSCSYSMDSSFWSSTSIDALGTILSSGKPGDWTSIIQTYIDTPLNNHIHLFTTYATVTVRTKTDDITLVWLPKIHLIKSGPYIVGQRWLVRYTNSYCAPAQRLIH